MCVCNNWSLFPNNTVPPPSNTIPNPNQETTTNPNPNPKLEIVKGVPRTEQILIVRRRGVIIALPQPMVLISSFPPHYSLADKRWCCLLKHPFLSCLHLPHQARRALHLVAIRHPSEPLAFATNNFYRHSMQQVINLLCQMGWVSIFF